MAAQGGCQGPAAADQAIPWGFLSFLLPPQRLAAQPALPATEIFPGFASKRPWRVCRSMLISFLGCAQGTRLVSGWMRWRGKEEGAFAAAAGAGFRGALAWGEPENESICLLLH